MSSVGDFTSEVLMKELGVTWRVSFSSFSLQPSEPAWLLWRDPTPSQTVTDVSCTDSFPTHCPVSASGSARGGAEPSLEPTRRTAYSVGISAPVVVWTTPWPLLIPLRYNAYSLYRVALKAQSLSESLPTHCRFNAPVAVQGADPSLESGRSRHCRSRHC